MSAPRQFDKVLITGIGGSGGSDLAAHANVRASFDTPTTVLANNILGTSNLFEAVRLAGLDPLIQLCSTSEVCGQVRSEEVPIREDAPLRPADVTLQIPDVGKFFAATGWKPRYPFEESMAHLLQYWRKQVKHEAPVRT